MNAITFLPTNLRPIVHVTIEERITWMAVHVDDIDGAAQDPRDAKAILEKMQNKFGISVIEPKYMLGIQR